MVTSAHYNQMNGIIPLSANYGYRELVGNPHTPMSSRLARAPWISPPSVEDLTAAH
jgi:hypothetical protein